ncbi:MAG TPA: class I SAM-dependent methyltransferase [Candidatus Acidoferrum sp.]|nr:class I SAM-dependent methyltransferase [Candidatus Acidoferrum sp.]
MAKTWSFDSELTRNYTRVRQAFISDFLDGIRTQVPLQSALDVGCGLGYFSKFLLERGLNVVAVDGRDENAEEGQRRYPEITFLTRNAEDPALPQIGVFDFVLCVGLLYHLENPFQAIRNLHALTGKVLIVESMCAPGPEPALLLLDECEDDNQGLNYVAFYPTESCLVKMLCRAGFPFVYSFKTLPDDPAFRDTKSRTRERVMMVASKAPLDTPKLVMAKEPMRDWDIWAAPPSWLRSQIRRVRRELRQIASQPASKSSETNKTPAPVGK